MKKTYLTALVGAAALSLSACAGEATDAAEETTDEMAEEAGEEMAEEGAEETAETPEADPVEGSGNPVDPM